MTTEAIGMTFPPDYQYGPEEIAIFKSTEQQIEANFPSQRNLLINTTWFGPQFPFGRWKNIQQMITEGQKFDNLFLLAVIDPIYILDDQIAELEQQLGTQKTYRIGMFEHGDYTWNFHVWAFDIHGPKYRKEDLELKSIEHLYVMYQRKPRRHRVEITLKLLEEKLDKLGIITLGANDANFDWSDGLVGPVLTIDDHPSNYKHNGEHTDYGGIPNDLVTLGRLDIWQNHFLNIISEMEYNHWHPMFVTEKTFKPIIGLRPFIIHGQQSVYPWLRKHGFKTFNQYWSHIPVETDRDVHSTTTEVIKFLAGKSKDELWAMYNDMLPDLEFNRNRFFEYAREQKYLMDHLFE
jgi:hypothetical protein